MDQLVLRNTTVADYDAVLRINEVYGGGDYLPYFYRQFMAAPHMCGYMAEMPGGKVPRSASRDTAGESDIDALYDERNNDGVTTTSRAVAFCLGHVTDRQRTLTLRAARVAQSVQGQGILRNLKNFATKEEKRMHPSMDKVRLTVGYPTSAVENIPGGFSEVLRRKLLCFCFRLSSFVRQTAYAHVSKLQKIKSRDMLKKIFESPDVSRDMFPAGVAIINWVPYATCPSNIPLIDFESDIYVSNKNENENESRPSLSDEYETRCDGGGFVSRGETMERTDNSGQIPNHTSTCLSAVTSFPCPFGLRVGVDVYHSQNIDNSSILEHIKTHVYNAASQAASLGGIEFVHFEVFVDSGFPVEVIKSAVKDLGLAPSDAVRDASDQNVLLLQTNL